MIKGLLLWAVAILLLPSFSAFTEKETMDFKTFLKDYEARMIPLDKEANLAWYKAAISGKDEDYKQAEKLKIDITKILSNKKDYETLKRLKESRAVTDPILKRELALLLNDFRGHQAPPEKLEEIVKIQTAIEQKFSTYRATVNGKTVTDNEIEDLLGKETDSALLQEAWLGSKQVGALVEKDVLALVEKRNSVARDIGFKNYHDMSLKLDEQDPDRIEALFDQLDSLTRDKYREIKDKEIDPFLSARLNVPAKDLMPWHYQNRFFQQAPAVYHIDMDSFYKSADVVQLARKFYTGIGLDVDGILANSDLYEKPGKEQHAFSADMDRNGDVRILLNARNDFDWMETTLHELGHAVYEQGYAGTELPWVLRQEAHTFITEAIAMMFGRLAANPNFMKSTLGLAEKDTEKIADDSFRMVRLQEIVFSRWSQVMYHFEKSLYENPKQDLNALWWNLVEKYQMIKKPEGRNAPDWASKIHIATVPCYYHNYLLGELLASQINAFMVRNIIKNNDFKNPDYAGRPEIGEYLVKKIFMRGKSLPWNELISSATGEELTPKYFADQFLN